MKESKIVRNREEKKSSVGSNFITLKKQFVAFLGGLSFFVFFCF